MWVSKIMEIYLDINLDQFKLIIYNIRQELMRNKLCNGEASVIEILCESHRLRKLNISDHQVMYN
jgi:hypothetical protein